VFRARDTRLERDVAVKLSTAHTSVDPKLSLDRFERELKLSSRVNHPHILQVHDCGALTTGHPYVLLEWMAEGPLSLHVVRAGDAGLLLPMSHVACYARAIAVAMRVVHQAQMVHRDLKPDNVLINAQGIAKLADVGVARDLRPGAGQLTETGTAVGTLGFMALEQLDGMACFQSDIFSFGVTLYALVTGRLPEQVRVGGLPVGVIEESAWDLVPETLRPLLQHCTAAHVEDRVQSFDELLPLLQAADWSEQDPPALSADEEAPRPISAAAAPGR